MAVHRQEVTSADVGSSDLRDFTGFLLRRAFVQVVGAERACLPDDNHVTEVTLLSVLAERGALSQRELGDLTHVNRTIVVKVVDALEARGWVVRERNRTDRRSYALRLTAAGRTALTQLGRNLDEADHELTRRLSREETLRLKRRLLQLLVDDPVIEVESLAGRTGFLIARAHRTFRALAERQLEPLGIHPRHFGVLAVVGREQPCSQSLVASRMGISPAAVLGFIDELELAGLLQRGRNDTDRRSYDLTLTATGERCLAEATAAAQQLQAQVVQRLSGEGDRDLRSLLTKIIA